MPVPLETDSEFTRGVRARRLVQISSFVALIVLTGMVPYFQEARWEIVGPMVFAALMMGVCQLLNRKGRTDLAIVVLLVSLMARDHDHGRAVDAQAGLYCAAGEHAGLPCVTCPCH